MLPSPMKCRRSAIWFWFSCGTILRTVSQDEALKIESALCCVEEAMRTDEAESADAAFADIIENTGKLPPHLQKLVGQKTM